MKPNFLYIGADKCGSTWIYKCLEAHPQVYVPVCKDLQFFDLYFDKGLKWYESFFKNVPPQCKAVGELSHNYLFSYQAAKRIKETLPEVKLICCLRNPVERAFACYLYKIKEGNKVSFKEAMVNFPEVLEKSKYFRYLKTYFRLFDKKQLLILFYEELKHNPHEFIKKIYDFINVNPAFKPYCIGKIILPGSRPRNYILAKLAHKGAILTRRLGFPNVVGIFNNSRLVFNLLYKPYVDTNRPKIDPNTEKELYKFYEADINALEDLLKTSVPNSWRKYKSKRHL
ncbi:MAG TPA: hypothetical protein ENG48_07050 [Candidatus Atribacteria bacterium]|mgnify:CR=1 FL=1|nr:hypothetical protein [Candidatus Atribacteria bacterium]